MSDIELVVKISEDSYKATCNGYMLPLDVENVVQGIKNGTPLPKGHGRLKDVDALMRDYGNSDIKILLDNMDTIIEADKENKE